MHLRKSNLNTQVKRKCAFIKREQGSDSIWRFFLLRTNDDFLTLKTIHVFLQNKNAFKGRGFYTKG